MAQVSLKRGDLVNALWALNKSITSRDSKPTWLALTGENAFSLMPTEAEEPRPVMPSVDGEWVSLAGSLALGHLVPHADLNNFQDLHRLVVDGIIGGSICANGGKGPWSHWAYPLHHAVAQREQYTGRDHWAHRISVWPVDYLNWTETNENNLIEAHRSHWGNAMSFDFFGLCKAAHAWSQDNRFIGGIPTYHVSNRTYGVFRIPRDIVDEFYSDDIPGLSALLGKYLLNDSVGCAAQSRIRNRADDTLKNFKDDAYSSLYIGDKVPGHGWRVWMIPRKAASNVWFSPPVLAVGQRLSSGSLDSTTIAAMPDALQIGDYPYATIGTIPDAEPAGVISIEEARKKLYNGFNLGENISL